MVDGIPLTAERLDGHARWRGSIPSYVYAKAGNSAALWAQRDTSAYQSGMRAAITCWNAAIARGFVCC